MKGKKIALYCDDWLDVLIEPTDLVWKGGLGASSVEEIAERKRNHNQSLLYAFGRGYVRIYRFINLIATLCFAEQAMIC